MGSSLGEIRKLVCNVDAELLAQIDAYAEELHINRTAAVSVLLSTALKQNRLMNDITRMMDAIDEQKQVTKFTP